MVIVSNPRTFKIPDWFLNRQKDHKDGRFSQLTSSALDTKLREDLERLKKIRYKQAASKKWIEPFSNITKQASTWLYDALGCVCGLCMRHMIGSQQHTRPVSIRSLQLALPLMGKYSKYIFVGTCACSNCLDVLAGITEVCDTTGACVSRVSIQRPLADVERLLVLQRSVKKLPLPCNNRCVCLAVRGAQLIAWTNPIAHHYMYTNIKGQRYGQRPAIPITFWELLS